MNLKLSHTHTSVDPPTINIEPVDQLNIVAGMGNIVTFTVVALGKSLVYQWQMDGQPLSNGAKYTGADRAALTVNNVVASDEGNYQVTVSNEAGSVDSAVVMLTTCK